MFLPMLFTLFGFTIAVPEPPPTPPPPAVIVVAPVTVTPTPAIIAAPVNGYNFGPWTELVRCESGFNPQAWNPASGASGAWQFLQTTWDWVAADAGWPHLIGTHAGAFPLETQHAMAEHLRTMPGGGLSHWVCGGYG